MAAAAAAANQGREREGTNLLGSPTFNEVGNGRLRCVETGHELLIKDKDAYSHCKACRLGLVDYALSHAKPPLNMFKQDPRCRSKLICKLTGDTVNKTEEHIWKHINGRRFLNKLEAKETKASPGSNTKKGGKNGKNYSEVSENGVTKESEKKRDRKLKADGAKQPNNSEEGGDHVSEDTGTICSVDDEEPEFWMPPVGDRWDFDDGGERWGSETESEVQEEEEHASACDRDELSEEASLSTKRVPEEIELGRVALKRTVIV